MRHLSRALFVWVAVFLGLVVLRGPGAAAQTYDGCYVRGQQVSDSACGNGGGPSTPSPTANPAFGALSTLSYGAGFAIGKAIRDSLTAPPTNNAPAAQPDADAAATAARKAEQDRQLQMRQQNDQLQAARDRRAFQEDQQNLVGRVRELGGSEGGDLHVVGTLKDAVASPGSDEPHPVARLDGIDPRDYPDLLSFTADQHAAHKLNNDGNFWADVKHDWVTALSLYSEALDKNPNGPFSVVIKENIAIATRHLDAQRVPQGRVGIATSATPGPSATPSGGAPAKATPVAQRVPPKAVLPKTYAECNAEFQAQTDHCQRPDGSWDRDGCFNPAKSRFDSCVKGLSDASFR